MKRAVIYFGQNNPRGHKRGVENVIDVQAAALKGCRKYYVFFDQACSVNRWGDIAAIGLRFGRGRFIVLNLLICLLYHRLHARGYTVIIHSHHYLMSLFLWKNSDAFSVHDGLWYQKRTVGSRLLPLFWLIEHIVYLRSTAIHCNSQFTYDNSLLPLRGRRAEIIYCSTPFERIAPDNSALAPGVSPSPSAVTILSVRSMEPRARVDLILDVAERTRDRGLPFTFVVAGKGPLLGSFRDAVRDRHLESVQLLGYVGDSTLAYLYANCTMVLLTCEDGEGFGLPVIEGYLFGKPVIASNRCAVPEVIISREFLVDNDPAEILQRILALAGARYSAERFASYYKQRFSFNVIGAEFLRFYDSLFTGIRGAA
jgi:glycosyltransferase involved in cell wall biosynthesis